MPKTTQELIAQFKDMPFGTILIDKYAGTRICFIHAVGTSGSSESGIRVVAEGDTRVATYYFDDFHDFCLVTEGEYAEIQQQNEKKELEKQEFAKLYPIGTPVVAVSHARGTVYCFIVSDHGSNTIGLYGGLGLFPKDDYKFFVVGKEFQVCVETGK